MQIVVFGLSHDTAPVEIREKMYVCAEDTPDLLRAIREKGIPKCVVLSTCNRTEVYYIAEEPGRDLSAIREVCLAHFGIDAGLLDDFTYVLVDSEAYRHLFLVASGLDSMVVGEPQILGQVKDAYRMSTQQGCTAFHLDKMFHRAFRVAKRVRTETKIGYNPVSISSMAVEMTKKIFGALPTKKVLVIGAGEMCEIALRHFHREGIQEVFITNRTYENARKLSEEHMGTPFPFHNIPELLLKADLILSSTGSERPIIDRDLVASVMKKRKNRPLFFIDIAVPRDIDPLVNDLENVYLYDIDDLRELSLKHLSSRIRESEKAQSIVEEEVQKFSHWFEHLDVAPLITHIIHTSEAIREKECRRTLQKIKGLDQEALKHVETLTRSIVKKMVHLHIAAIRNEGVSPELAEMVKKIFRFEEPEEDEKEMDRGDEGQ